MDSRIFRGLMGLALMLGLVGCSKSSELEPQAPVADCLQIVGRTKSFNSKEVGTKSVKTDEESKVSNMMMYVFDSAGDVVDVQYLEGSSPLFMLDRNSDTYAGHTQSLMTAAHIYVFANVPSDQYDDFAGVQSLSELLDMDLNAQIGIPDKGFPMLGNSDALDLSTSSTLAGEVIEIPLVCLYAKVVFSISVNPTQSVDEVVQKFAMERWTVHNVPSKLNVGEPASDAETEFAETADTLSAKTFTSYTGSNPAQESGSPLVLSFYMPENKLNPETSSDTYAYPWKGRSDASSFDDYRQHYKPLLPSKSQHPTYVEISGKYYDHNNREKQVTYAIYLGENNYDNYYICRDCQLNNYITIKGTTNTMYETGIGDDDDDVSVDHRVDIQQTEFKFELERETLVDSHWEIRPIRITLDASKHPGSKVTVEILNPDTADWLRMELTPSDLSAGSWCTDGLAKGKRKYFTTDLVTSTLNTDAGKKVTINATEGTSDYCIWMYIDEYVSESDGNVTRSAKVRACYYEAGSNTPAVQEDYLFRQRNIYKVSYSSRNYFIEYFEEYLYNFDSAEKYGSTTDGMAWGLDGQQISKNNQSFEYSGGGIFKSLINSLISSKKPYYDFYISSSEANGTTSYPYSGLQFTEEIAEECDFGSHALQTDEMPDNAVEYCFNRNKRNSDGSITVSDIHWYMPAIDEIEDICMGGYSDFEVFQNKYYWSSQPAYIEYRYNIYYLGSNHYGYYFVDDVNRARSTKVDSDFSTVNSGVTTYKQTVRIKAVGSNETTDNSAWTSGNPYEEGNQPRTNINRIRCVYKP